MTSTDFQTFQARLIRWEESAYTQTKFLIIKPTTKINQSGKMSCKQIKLPEFLVEKYLKSSVIGSTMEFTGYFNQKGYFNFEKPKEREELPYDDGNEDYDFSEDEDEDKCPICGFERSLDLSQYIKNCEDHLNLAGRYRNKLEKSIEKAKEAIKNKCH